MLLHDHLILAHSSTMAFDHGRLKISIAKPTISTL